MMRKVLEQNYFVSCSLICGSDKPDQVCLNISRDLACIPSYLYSFLQTAGIILLLIPLFAVQAKAWHERIVIRIKPETNEQISSLSQENLLQSHFTPRQDAEERLRAGCHAYV